MACPQPPNAAPGSGGTLSRSEARAAQWRGVPGLPGKSKAVTIAVIEDAAWKTGKMAQLTVRKLSEEVVSALKRRAAANGRSAEAEHRAILRETLVGTEEEFAVRAAALRRRLRSPVDSTATIRADRDRDSMA